MRDVRGRPVYAGERSGVRWFTVLYPIGFLLARALARRLAGRAVKGSLRATAGEREAVL